MKSRPPRKNGLAPHANVRPVSPPLIETFSWRIAVESQNSATLNFRPRNNVTSLSALLIQTDLSFGEGTGACTRIYLNLCPHPPLFPELQILKGLARSEGCITAKLGRH
jgi:hypothetical protein